MTVRSVNVQTGEKTSRPLTQEEVDGASVRTIAEIEKRVAQTNPDVDIQLDLGLVNPDNITDIPTMKAEFTKLLNALNGNGPNQTKVKGRK